MKIRNNWTVEELSEIYHLPLFELLARASDVHREFHNYTELDGCKLVSVKTGGCQEDCKYCAQSSRYKTDVKAEKILSKEEAVALAQEGASQGARRICLGMGQREVRDNTHFERVLEIVEALTEMGLEVCCTLGMLKDYQLKKLKEVGLFAYNHNIDTSEKFYPKIITTRTYQDRLETLERIQSEKLHLCCGGIIGMGEALEDRLEMLQVLATRVPHPQSVPINRLVPIKGTPLGEQQQTDTWEVTRLIATARITMPQSVIRLSAGRQNWSDEQHALCFMAGANSIFLGEKCLTVGNSNKDRDTRLLNLFGMRCRPIS